MNNQTNGGKLQSFLSHTLTSSDVEKKGQKLYKLGKLFMLIGLVGFSLMLFTALLNLIFDGDADALLGPFIFKLRRQISFAYLFVALGYLGTLLGIVGIFFYNVGINRFALGHIAVNTEKNANTAAAAASDDELPEL